jgi:hypothetical protein
MAANKLGTKSKSPLFNSRGFRSGKVTDPILMA